MTFTRCRAPISFPYTINGTNLCPIVTNVCDLGFTFTPSLCPRAHLDNITCKALKVLGFIKRIASEFKLSNSLKAIYCALDRPIVEYGSVVWDPQTAEACKQLERVQRRFLSFVKYNFNITCEPHDYTPVLRFLQLSTLSDRRYQYNLSFLRKLLSGSIDSPSLLALINIKIPIRHTRNSASFHITHCSTNYLKNEPLSRMMKIANENPSFFF